MVDPSPHAHRFRVGGFVGKTLSVWGRTFPLLVFPAVAVYSPLIYWTVVVTRPIRGVDFESAEAFLWTPWKHRVLLLSVPLHFLVAGLLAYPVLRVLAGKPAPLDDVFAMARRRLIPSGLLSLLCTLVVLGPLVLSGVGWGAGGVSLVILAWIGTAFGYCVVWVALPSCGAERSRVFRALSRSAFLTRGRRFHLLGGMVSIGLIGFLGARLPMEFLDNVEAKSRLIWSVRLFLGGLIVLGTIQAVAMTVAFHELRREKEGEQTDELVAVFE